MNQVNQHDFGEPIRVSQEEREWTQRYLAEKVGISRSLLSKVEKGTRQLSEEKLNLVLDSLQEEVVPVNRVLIDYLTIHFFSNQHYVMLMLVAILLPILLKTQGKVLDKRNRALSITESKKLRSYVINHRENEFNILLRNWYETRRTFRYTSRRPL